MTFNNIQNGDPLDPSKVMENFRHRNFGSDLLPSDASGNPVDNTLDLGSATYGWKDAYVNNLIVNGEFSVANQPTCQVTNGTCDNFGDKLTTWGATAKNVGGFTVSGTKVYVPSAGAYSVQATAVCTSFDSSFITTLYISRYNSSDVSQFAFVFFRDNSAAIKNGNGNVIIYFDSGDYVALRCVSSGGSTSDVASASLSITKLF